MSDPATNPCAPSLAEPHRPGPPRPRRQRLAARGLDMAWRRGWLAPPMLDPEERIAAVERISGGLRLAKGCWRGRLDILAAALNRQAALNPLGRVIAHGQITAALLNRARLQALWARHPEIGAIALPPPILIVGHMRSGSTRVQRLLACDPRLDYTRFYESWNPLPRRLGGAWNDRATRAWLMLRCAHALNPDFRHIHPTGTWQADEEMGLQNISFFGAAFEAQWRVPDFTAQVEAEDGVIPYAEFKRLLQTIAWLRRRPMTGRWVLKLPQFAQDLDAVLATFPDATVIRLRRDPAQVVASSASLVANQMRVQSDDVDPRWIGQEWLRKTALRERRTSHALAGRAARVEIAFEAVDHDWRDAMAAIYSGLGMALLPEVERHMARFMAAQPQKRLARHRYSLAGFGLTAAAVDRAMAAQAPQVVRPAGDASRCR